MSGPKVDHAELERRKKEELERARQEKLRQIRIETEKLDTIVSKIQSQIDQINESLAHKIRETGDAEVMALVLQNITALKTKHKNSLVKLLSYKLSSEPSGIARLSRELADNSAAIMKKFTQEMKEHEERLDDYIKHVAVSKKLDEISSALSSKAEKVLDIGDVDFSFRAHKVQCSDVEIPIKEKATEVLAQIEALVNSESIQESDMSVLIAVADNIYQQAFESNESFEAAIIQYEAIRNTVVKNIAIFDSAYQDYITEFVVYNEKLNEFEKISDQSSPYEKYQFASIDELQEEAAQISNLSKIYSERNYIREQLDDVMRTVGYNLSEAIIIDERQIDKNQTGSDYICVSRNGQSAIHVNVSGNKRIMMEVVGVGRSKSAESNSPVNAEFSHAEDLDEQKKAKIVSEQMGFCEIHPQIVAELKKRGVIFNEESHRKPNARYCKEYIKITKSSEKASDNQRQYSAPAEQRKAINKQQMRYMRVKG
ncbi:MAG: hypothetical protein FWH17_05085 [Oscillospiraceae bacterium]|nr:hypothetical protein [Oscillospiraceae bacterium]